MPVADSPAALLSRGGSEAGDRPLVTGVDLAPVETEVGGVFYLLNVALALGLYGDFTKPRGPRLDISIWRFIALVARGLLRGAHPDDPLWLVLDDLAGPRAPDLQVSAAWRVEPEWVQALQPPLRRAPRLMLRGTTFERFLRWHTRHIRARVARALGVPAARAGELLCAHHASVRVGPARVDVAFSLDELPIAIRMSGLDRDPGWIPSADRTVAFSYD
jgi:hypothetical protein